MGQVKVAENKRLINDSANSPWPKTIVPLNLYGVERSIFCLDTFLSLLFMVYDTI